MAQVNACEPEGELELKYGRFAHSSWRDRCLCLKKMDAIMTKIGGEHGQDGIRHMLADKLEVLAISKDELTPANGEPFRIELINREPSFEKPLRYNQKLTQFVDQEVNALVERGMIYPADTPWAAKVILAPKGDSWRMCLNYVGVNAKIKADRFPLPNIEDIYTFPGGKKFFSKMDLLSRYW